MPIEVESDKDIIRMAEMAENMPLFDNESDKKLHVTFRMDAERNDARSRDEGRPIFEMTEFIRIMVPGDKDTVIDRPANDFDRARFAERYERFKRGMAQVQGSPLSEEQWLSKAQTEELRFFGIVTLEQLAGMADVHAGKFLGIQDLKRKALARMELLKQAEPVNHLQAITEKQNEIIKAQEAQIAQMGERLAKLEAAPKKG